MYWINERDAVRRYKESGVAKPWSNDPIFQETYFCNVRREDDKVTKWIRENYTPEEFGSLYEWAICIARLLNWPATLETIKPFMVKGEVDNIITTLRINAAQGHKIWGNAYVVTTHGIKTDKLSYLHRIAQEALNTQGLWGCLGNTLSAAHASLKRLEGFSDFMAAQVVADLKNTEGHPLRQARDWWTWAAPGPGSLRGMRWYFGRTVGPNQFLPHLRMIHEDILHDLPYPICYQDLQNCLCEYDKFMRVLNGTGRSKRKYDGR